MNSLEIRLAKLHNRKYCLLTGNGTTAIYSALVSQYFVNKKIAIPSNVCMNVVLPIYFSNNIPIFVDIERETLGLNIAKIENTQIDGLIAVHAYGNVCDIENIEKYCQTNDIFLIEDVAVAQGLNISNRPLGSFGNVSVLSFGSGKNIDMEHGGAILTDDEIIYTNIKNIIHQLEEYSTEKENVLDSISKQHTKLYNIDYGKTLNKYYKKFKKLCMDNKDSLLYKFDKSFEDKLNNGLNNLNELIMLRQKNSSYLKSKFQDINGITILEPCNKSSYWRFNIFVEKHRDELFSYLLNKKYKVSSWYHPLEILFENKKVNTPISNWIGENIINIWVNEEIDKKYLDDISNDIINFLRGKNGK